MKYYVSEHTAMAIINGIQICDVYMPRTPQGKRTVEINIEIISDIDCLRPSKPLSDPDDYIREEYF